MTVHKSSDGTLYGPVPGRIVSDYEPEKNANNPFKKPFKNLELLELGQKLFDAQSNYVPQIEDTTRRIRGLANGHVIFDTTKAKMVWEHKWFFQYWIPRASLKTNSEHLSSPTPVPGTKSVNLHDLRVENHATSTTRVIKLLLVDDGPLSGYVKVNFSDLDEWLEEQSRIEYHPRDPYHRVDVLPSGRHIRIEVDGVVLADTGSEGGVMSLWETRFPGRWYLPRTSANFEYLSPSETHTGCPYKGEASYYDINLPNGKKIEDGVWWYRFPLWEATKIQGMLCFYPDKVDMWIDGEKV